jgi:hypothetical protein
LQWTIANLDTGAVLGYKWSVWNSIGIKFQIDTGGGHIGIKSFYRFRKVLIAPALINFSFKYNISPLFVGQVITHRPLNKRP